MPTAAGGIGGTKGSGGSAGSGGAGSPSGQGGVNGEPGTDGLDGVEYTDQPSLLFLDANGGDSGSAALLASAAPATSFGDIDAALAATGSLPSRTGHTFTGWFAAPSGGSPVAASTTISTLGTVYAQWSSTQHTVTFDSNGGDPVPPASVNYGDPVTVPSNPNRAGYTFMGWDDTTDAAWDFATPVTASVTLHALWSDDSGGPGCLIVDEATLARALVAANGTGYVTLCADLTLTSTTVPTGVTLNSNRHTIILPSGGSLEVDGTLVNDGTITGAGTLSADRGFVDNAGTITAGITVSGTHNVTGHNYILEFDGQGGDAPTAIRIYAYNFDDAQVPFPANPVRAGYTFMGWNSAADGSGTTVTASTDLRLLDPTVIPLFAQWKADAIVKPVEPPIEPPAESAPAEIPPTGSDVMTSLWGSGSLILLGAVLLAAAALRRRRCS